MPTNDHHAAKAAILKDKSCRRCRACGQPLIDAAQASQDQQRFLKRLLNREEELHTALASAIHDQLAQQLAGAVLYFEAAEQQANFDQQTRDAFRMGLKLLRDGIHEARRIAGRLRPPMSTVHGITLGIEYLIHELLSEDGPEITFTAKGDLGRLSPELENATFSILRELLTNACYHSRSRKVQLQVERTPHRLRLEIEDGGVGFDVNGVPESAVGLRHVEQRARLLGGQMMLDSAPGAGTRVVVSLPIDDPPRGEPSTAGSAASWAGGLPPSPGDVP